MQEVRGLRETCLTHISHPLCPCLHCPGPFGDRGPLGSCPIAHMVNPALSAHDVAAAEIRGFREETPLPLPEDPLCWWREHQQDYPQLSKALSPSEKKRFEDMAKADKVRYNREMRDYVPPKGFGKRGRKRKDPNAPKRPPSAFFVFCSEYRPSVKQQYPGLSIGDCAKKLGEMWSKLSQSEKQPYEEKAQKLREKYDRDMVAYRGGGTYTRNPDSSAQGAGEEEDEEGEDEDEEEEDDE
ncbi:high mobility group protein B1 [Austrofundulus limnaeus]|uniref:High mobility group protein B1 n=1 Tax=Austrofundulus limnaeus TaxID=52670 RepID=A0A2I4AIM6_AUSLI|nr:PREDICTED: high mobility group protein B1-like [Austrofundulus limnaeus]